MTPWRKNEFTTKQHITPMVILVPNILMTTPVGSQVSQITPIWKMKLGNLLENSVQKNLSKICENIRNHEEIMDNIKL